MAAITLKLWVSNQEGTNCDCTTSYIEATSWAPPSGVTLDVDAPGLSGDAEETWRAYRSLARAVAAVGHGQEIGDEPAPVLTACPSQLVEEGYTCAAEALAQIESPLREEWADFAAAVML